MSTQLQKDAYGHLGNERLKPMAVAGNAGAIAILEDRGNVLTDEGHLRKTRSWIYTDGMGVEHDCQEVVEDGKMVGRTVDGVAITGNIVQFR